MEKINGNPVQANQHAAEKKVLDAEEQKKKKAESAKAWKEKKDAEEKLKQETAKEFIKFLADKKIDVPEKFSKLLNDFAYKTSRNSGSGNTIFNKLFGDAPKVGDSIELIEVFRRTYKSVAEINRLCKEWKAKGIEVEFEQASDNFKSKYVIKKILPGCAV